MTMPGGRTLADAYVALHVDATKVPADVKAKTEGPIGDAGEKAGHNFGSRMGKAIAAATAAGAAVLGVKLVQALNKSISSASDLNETLSKTDAVFGKQGQTIKTWAKNVATDFGQSQKSALDAASTFAVYGKQANLTGKDLFNFSTHLTGLASDMASFSNTSPEDAIEALGAAFRGESDPIEKYGVLLNEARLQAVALDKGIVKSVGNATKVKAANIAVTAAQQAYNRAVKEHGKNSAEASLASRKLDLAQTRLKEATKGTVPQLTAQQRILAVQAAVYDQLGKKGSNAIGDFERTMNGLANQQRIAKANTENLRAEIGQAFLPVVVKLYQTFNSKVAPALRDLWQKYGPQVTAWANDAADKLDDLAGKLDEVDWAAFGAQVKTAFASLKQDAGPALQQIKDSAGPLGKSLKEDVVPALKDMRASGGKELSDALKVTGTVMGFLADHLDTLAKILPGLVIAYGAMKVAQLGANVAAAASPVIRLLEVKAMRQHTAALAENTVATRASRAATVSDTVATAANTGAENAGMLTRIRATAATIASTIAQKAVRAATIAWTAVQWALNAALTANPIGLVVAAIVALIAIIVLAYKKNETFRNIVNAVWAAIKVAIKAVADWFVNTVWPSLKKAFDQLMTVARAWWKVASTVWKGVWDVISTYYSFMWNKVFKPLANIMLHTVPDAFKKGASFIGSAWDAVKAAAKNPVDFVVNTVLNKGIIGSLNWLAGKVGITKTIPTIPWSSGTGGGHKPTGDKISGNIKNDGYGHGTRQGDGLGSVLMSPAKWLAGKIGLGRIADRFGNNPFTRVLTGAGGQAKNWAVDKIQTWLAEMFRGSGGSVGAGGLRSGIAGVLAALRGSFGSVPLISGLRPGATTLSGATSYHASGRAIDIAPVRAWAEFINARYGRQLRELITPWQDLNIWNGHPHTYHGAVWNQHNFAGGNAHIHAAMDSGGWLVPGWNSPIYNGTGQPEAVTPPSTMEDVVDRLERILEALEMLAPLIGRELTGASASALHLARARGAR